MKFRRRSPLVDAVQVGSIAHKTLAGWCGGQLLTGDFGRIVGVVQIGTVGGFKKADIGDWVVKDGQGFFTVWTPGAFEAEFEVAPL